MQAWLEFWLAEIFPFLPCFAHDDGDAADGDVDADDHYVDGDGDDGGGGADVAMMATMIVMMNDAGDYQGREPQRHRGSYLDLHVRSEDERHRLRDGKTASIGHLKVRFHFSQISRLYLISWTCQG